MTGRRFAEVLDGAGARVVLASRRHDLDVELACRLRDALPVRCDIRDPVGPDGPRTWTGALRWNPEMLTSGIFPMCERVPVPTIE